MATQQTIGWQRMGVHSLMLLLLISATSGCVSTYAGPPSGAPAADISFSLVPGEKKYRASFALMQSVSRDKCYGDSAFLGQIKQQRSQELTGVRIPADQEIEISVSVTAPSFPVASGDLFTVLFTPINGRSYRFELEWDKDYRDVRVIELAADGQMRQIAVRGEECSLFTFKRKPIKLG